MTNRNDLGIGLTLGIIVGVCATLVRHLRSNEVAIGAAYYLAARDHLEELEFAYAEDWEDWDGDDDE